MSTSSPDLSLLYTPVQLGAWHLPNRLIAGAMTRNRGIIPTPLNAAYYAQRARHAGLIISEGILIEPQGCEWPYAPGLFNQEQVEGWRVVTDAVHREGGLIIAQLWHVGRLAHPLHQAGQPAAAPSAVAAKGGKFRLLPGVPGYQMPRAIDDPSHYVRLFHTAAVNAKSAGFDGVQLQGAGGYLLHQFLDPTANVRPAPWGGSIANRARFTLDCVDALIQVWGASRVAIKLQPAGGFNDVGSTHDDIVDTYGYLLRQLSKRGLAFAEIQRHLPFLDPMGRGLTDAHLDVAREVGVLYDGAVVLNGGFDEAEKVARVVEEGQAQAVTIGRLFMANADLPVRWQRGAPLNEIDWAHAYGQDGVPAEVGMLDYPLLD